MSSFMKVCSIVGGAIVPAGASVPQAKRGDLVRAVLIKGPSSRGTNLKGFDMYGTYYRKSREAQSNLCYMLNLSTQNEMSVKCNTIKPVEKGNTAWLVEGGQVKQFTFVSKPFVRGSDMMCEFRETKKGVQQFSNLMLCKNLDNIKALRKTKSFFSIFNQNEKSLFFNKAPPKQDFKKSRVDGSDAHQKSAKGTSIEDGSTVEGKIFEYISRHGSKVCMINTGKALNNAIEVYCNSVEEITNKSQDAVRSKWSKLFNSNPMQTISKRMEAMRSKASNLASSFWNSDRP